MPEPSARQPGPGRLVDRRMWFWYLLVLVAALFLLWNRPGNQPGATRLPYSDLKAKIESNEIRSVDIGKDEIEAVGTDPSQRWVATRVDDPGLVADLDAHHVQYAGHVESDWPGVLAAWAIPLLLLAAFWAFVLRRMRPGAGIMSIGQTRARLYTEEKGTGVTFGDVAGVDEAVDELREIVDFLASPERFRRLGGRIPKGVLLVGPPGTGKTLLARAVAGEAKVPFFSLTGADFVEMFVGVGAARVRDLFQQAQSKAPCIVFIDELDAVGKTRGAVGAIAGHDEREQTLNQLLAEMDGFDARKGLIVMAATNRPEILDAALLRPGRFDRQVLVDRPDVRGREAILQIHARGLKLAPEVDLRRIAALTSGFAGAELANVMNEGALLAARRNRESIGMSELSEAIERVVAGLERKNRRMNEREKNITAHHESGHALLAEVLPTTDRVHKVSLIPRGVGALGYTMQLPLEDRYLMTRAELLDKLTVLLGGRAAEQVIFNEISTGALDDLSRASDLARRMVTQYGMSETIGPQALSGLAGGDDAPHLPGIRLGSHIEYANRTEEAVDSEVGSLLRLASDRAIVVLRHNLSELKDLATSLLEHEMLEGADLRQILEKAEAPSELFAPDSGEARPH
jgi:cell division protease FtsH